MRWKILFEKSDVYSCCWCCHVRTGTVVFGILWLAIQVAILSLTAVVVIRCNVYDQCLLSDLVDETPTTATGIPESGWNELMKKLRNCDEDDKFASALMLGGSISVTLMLIYGATKGRPGYMMPFMGLQVFVFCLSGLTILSYLSDATYIKHFVAGMPPSKLKDFVLSIETDYLTLFIVLSSVGFLVVQAFIMGIVWSCYKYLNQPERGVNQAAVLRSYDSDMIMNSEDVEVLLPPKYEEVIAMPVGTNAPPAYSPN